MRHIRHTLHSQGLEKWLWDGLADPLGPLWSRSQSVLCLLTFIFPYSNGSSGIISYLWVSMSIWKLNPNILETFSISISSRCIYWINYCKFPVKEFGKSYLNRVIIMFLVLSSIGRPLCQSDCSRFAIGSGVEEARDYGILLESPPSASSSAIHNLFCLCSLTADLWWLGLLYSTNHF